MPNKPIIVVEDSFLRLRCAASGQPRPDIVWSRLDGRPITDGAWQGKIIKYSHSNPSAIPSYLFTHISKRVLLRFDVKFGKIVFCLQSSGMIKENVQLYLIFNENIFSTPSNSFLNNPNKHFSGNYSSLNRFLVCF